MTNNLPQASYRIEDVIIIESNFKRELIVSENETINNQIALNNTSQQDPDSNNFWIIMEATVDGKQDEVSIFTAKTVIVGIFEKIGEGELDMETFKKINGPAMLFPFLREHISSCSVKAGMKKILLPPINFTKQEPKELANDSE